MATNYTGNQASTQAPSPPPSENVAVIVSIPADGDSLNAASVMQAFKALADFSAWATKTGKRIIKQITANADPIFTFQDTAGSVRSFISPNGYLLGPSFRFSEDWAARDTGVTNTLTVGKTWVFDSVGATTGAYGYTHAGAFASGYPLPCEENLVSSTALANDYIVTRSPSKSFVPSANVSVEMLMDVGVSNAAAANNTASFWGFTTNFTAPGAQIDSVLLIADPTASANWQFFVANTTGFSSTDTGFAISAGQMLSARIELTGSSSPFGRKAKLWLDGNAFSVSANVPSSSAALYHGFGCALTHGAGTVNVHQYTGPLQLNINNGSLGIY